MGRAVKQILGCLLAVAAKATDVTDLGLTEMPLADQQQWDECAAGDSECSVSMRQLRGQVLEGSLRTDEVSEGHFCRGKPDGWHCKDDDKVIKCKNGDEKKSKNCGQNQQCEKKWGEEPKCKHETSGWEDWFCRGKDDGKHCYFNKIVKCKGNTAKKEVDTCSWGEKCKNAKCVASFAQERTQVTDSSNDDDDDDGQAELDNEEEKQ